MSQYKRLPPPAEPQAIRELARDIVAGRAIAHWMVPGDLLGQVFIPLGFGALDGYSRRQLDRLVVWAVHGRQKHAYYVNGYPMFVECFIWRRTDWAKAVELASKAAAVLEDA